jgi:hypothetical protein
VASRGRWSLRVLQLGCGQKGVLEGFPWRGGPRGAQGRPGPRRERSRRATSTSGARSGRRPSSARPRRVSTTSPRWTTSSLLSAGLGAISMATALALARRRPRCSPRLLHLCARERAVPSALTLTRGASGRSGRAETPSSSTPSRASRTSSRAGGARSPPPWRAGPCSPRVRASEPPRSRARPEMRIRIALGVPPGVGDVDPAAVCAVFPYGPARPAPAPPPPRPRGAVRRAAWCGGGGSRQDPAAGGAARGVALPLGARRRGPGRLGRPGGRPQRASPPPGAGLPVGARRGAGLTAWRGAGGCCGGCGDCRVLRGGHSSQS